MERVLEQVALSTGFEGTQNVHVALIGRQHDQFGIRELRSNRDQRIEAIHLRHLNVHQRHVRTVRAELLDGFPTVGRFCDHGHIRLNPHETGDPFAHDWMVVDDENPNGELPTSRCVSFDVSGVLEATRRDHQERPRGAARRRWQEGAAPPPFRRRPPPHRQLSADQCRTFRHAAQAIVSLNALARKHRGIDPLPSSRTRNRNCSSS